MVVIISSKVLVVSEKFWPEGGGGELATNLIADLLSREEGLQVEILSGTETPLKPNSVKYQSIPLLKFSNKIELWRNLFLLSRKDWFIEKLEYADIVYIPSFCFPLIPLAKRTSNRVIVQLHDYQAIRFSSVVFHDSNQGRLKSIKNTIRLEMNENKSCKRAFIGALFASINRLSRKWLSKADKLVCVSERQKKILAKETPELKPKMTVINNPAPNFPFHEKNSSKNDLFLYLGGDSYCKGFHHFLDVSKRILRNHSNVEFMVTGDLEKKNKLKINSLNKKFDNRYLVPGFITRERLLEVYSESKALFFPSVWEEPLPFVIMEAMLSGTIPVASRVGGVPEMVRGTYGEELLFDPENTKQQISKLETVLNLSENEIDKIGSNLKRKAEERFNSNRIANNLKELFR
ncbi:hypothetical protein AKJ52_00650 [candidate division MSBL1 archaeon SCGC-AAA382C18]|uniref:Glycosyl transferase family 1 domain-containing protein n=1 Tax=candidate division MSBL1 archaeon SCGC-AAA382C18 TaxID=1698281 RepID=A0A133VLC6_9EURY|nr:hypothetical protein AKJ52_00650 [candidate division MSBL1 archaeon SCGC-AAA382C18]